MKWWLLCILAACGDNRVPAVDSLDCGDASCAVGCTAVLTGNTPETLTSLEACPSLLAGVGDSLGHTILAFLVPSPALGTSLGIRIDLGAVPTPGDYSSETTAIWSAIAVKGVPPRGGCLFNAGSESSPAGHFALHLDAIGSIDPASATGRLALTMFVLPQTSEQGTPTDCGAGTTEDVALTF